MPYWRARSSLIVHKNILLYNYRIVISLSLQRGVLERIHEDHQGIVRCLMRASNSVWWPGISNQTTQLVHNCQVCAKETLPRTKPLISSPLPDYPWQVIGTDHFQFKGLHYLIAIDYFSRYPEITKLASLTSEGTIAALEAIFARHGIPGLSGETTGLNIHRMLSKHHMDFLAWKVALTIPKVMVWLKGQFGQSGNYSGVQLTHNWRYLHTGQHLFLGVVWALPK